MNSFWFYLILLVICVRRLRRKIHISVGCANLEYFCGQGQKLENHLLHWKKNQFYILLESPSVDISESILSYSSLTHSDNERSSRSRIRRILLSQFEYRWCEFTEKKTKSSPISSSALLRLICKRFCYSFNIRLFDFSISTSGDLNKNFTFYAIPKIIMSGRVFYYPNNAIKRQCVFGIAAILWL